MTEMENIKCECTGCMMGMELYTDKEGVKRKHTVYIEAPIGKYVHIKSGNFIPDRKCPLCEKEMLMRV